MEQPVEKKEGDIGPARIFVDFLIGFVVAVYFKAEYGKASLESLLLQAAVISVVGSYLLCRFITSIPRRGFVAMSVGMMIGGFWVMWTGEVGGSASVVLGLGNIIGANIAWYITAKKSSPAQS